LATRVEDQPVTRDRDLNRDLNRPVTTAKTDETKASFKTTEMIAYVATVAGVFVAASIDTGIDARLAWILVSALSIGYMFSRGFAKSGSQHRENADTI
jgi:hypothetical protein